MPPQINPEEVLIAHKIGRIPSNITIAKITEARVIIGNSKVDLITEAIIREVEVITKLIRDRILGAEATEEVVAMNKVKTIIGQTTSVEEAVVPFIDHGEPVEILREDVDLPRQVLGIHNTKEYHSTDTYVVFVIAEGIMITSVIPFNICFMLCNNKVANICHSPILIMTTLTKLINQLFRAGIPQP